MLRIGLTGGIACGKSVVVRRLQRAGLEVLDLDGVVHDLLSPGGAAVDGVVAAFGESFRRAEGGIDRRSLGERVFADEVERRRLEAIVHPLVRDEERRRASCGRGILVVDGALLVENGAHLRFVRLVVVHCDPATQLRRLIERDGLDETAARKRIDAQMPLAEKLAFGHFEIDTSGGLDRTERAADELAVRIGELAVLDRDCGGVLRREQLIAALQHGRAATASGPDPAWLLERVAADPEGLDLRAVARLTAPHLEGPWHSMGERSDGVLSGALAAALAVWARVRHGADPEWLAAAAASLGLLVHRRGDALSGAVFVALALHEALDSHNVMAPEASARARSLAARWGGGDVDADLERAMATGFRFRHDPTLARMEAERRGLRGDVAGAMAGLVGGKATEPWAERLDGGLALLTRPASQHSCPSES